MTLIIPAAAALGLLLLYDGLTSRSAGRSHIVTRRLDLLVRESGMRSMTGRRLLVTVVGAGLTTFFVIAGISSSAVVAVVFGIAAGTAPIAVVRSRRARRRRRFRESWPDVISTLIASVRAGISLAEACVALAEGGPTGLDGGFRAFAGTYRSTGSFATGLERLRAELADPVADRVVAALSLAHEVGGTDLVRVLRSLGDFVTDDLRVRKEIEARWSWTVTAARVAAAAPWAVLLLMSTRVEAVAAYNSPQGALIVLIGAAVTVLGYRLMLRAARLPEERRLVA